MISRLELGACEKRGTKKAAAIRPRRGGGGYTLFGRRESEKNVAVDSPEPRGFIIFAKAGRQQSALGIGRRQISQSLRAVCTRTALFFPPFAHSPPHPGDETFPKLDFEALTPIFLFPLARARVRTASRARVFLDSSISGFDSSLAKFE